MDALPLFMKLMQHERWDEACDVARNAMLPPAAPGPWPMLRSRAHAAAGRHAEALAFGRMAQELEDAAPAQGAEAMAAMWCAAGLVALLNKDFPAALEGLGNAYAMDPDIPDLAQHLALAAQSARQYATAVAMYRRVLAEKPEDRHARCNLYLCLMETGAHDAARDLLTTWPEALQASAEYVLASAHLLEHDGRYAECLAFLHTASPDDVSAEQGAMLDCLHGRCLRAQGKGEQAAGMFRCALENDPSSFAAVNELWMTLQSMGKYGEADAALERFSHAYGPNPVLDAKRALHVPAILESAAQADAIRRRIRDFLAAPTPFTVLGSPQEVLDCPPFYLAFHDRNDKDLLQSLAAFLLRHTNAAAPTGTGAESALCAPGDAGAHSGGSSSPAGRHAALSAVPLADRLAALRPGHAMRIGFISRFFTNHTIMSYFYRLLYDLCPRFAASYILEFPQADNPFRRDLAQRAKLVTLPTGLEAARSAVRDLDLDILVYTDLGMDLLTWSLAFSRLATVQCALYGHPVTTGIPAIDYFLSPAVMEPDDADAHYSEHLHTFPGLLSGFIPPPVPGPSPAKAAGETVYLCPQSLFKIHPDMDGVFRHILSQDTGAVIHCFASRHTHETEAFQERLRRGLPALHTRIRLLPQCAEELFLGHLRGADAVLDTPYFSGGSTSFKALGVGVPVVTMEGRFMRGRQTAGMYRHLGIHGLTADSLATFGDLAIHVAHSPALREEKQQALLETRDRLFTLESVDHLEQFFKRLPGGALPE